MLFALSETEWGALQAVAGTSDAIDMVAEEIEERWDQDWLYETDKNWWAIQRVLSQREPDYKFANSVDAAILAGEHISPDENYVISAKNAELVKRVSEALQAISDVEFESLARRMSWSHIDGPKPGKSFDAVSETFSELKAFYEKASSANRPVVFTVDY